MSRLADRYQHWRTETYPKYAPGLAALCLVVATFSSIGVVWLTKVQGDEQDRRAAGFAELQRCFDTYAVRSAATSKAVRVASVDLADATTVRDEATTARDVALDEVFNYIATDPPEDSPKGARLFSVLLSTNSALVEAQANLVKVQDELAEVREQNPVPEPPSSFCDVKP